MTDRAMFRYEVLVDDTPTIGRLTGDPVAVAVSADSRVVEFWAEHDPQRQPESRAFQVFGTGHPIPDGAVWRGTCPRTSLGLVWHLYEVTNCERW